MDVLRPARQAPVLAARILVPDAEGRILLLRRRPGGHGGGQWCLPGGKVDYGETVEAAVRRELAEETALRATSIRFLFYQDSLPIEPEGMHGVNLCFECRASGTLALAEDSTEASWVGLAELDRLQIAFRGAEAIRWYRKRGASSGNTPR